MIDLFDDIMQEPDIDTPRRFLDLLNTYLPGWKCSIITSHHQQINNGPDTVEIDPALTTLLEEKTKTENPCFHTLDSPSLDTLLAMRVEPLNSLLICKLPVHLAPDMVQPLLPATIHLCMDLFNKDRRLIEERELLLAHKQQRDKRISVLKKKYEEILIENQGQSAAYSKILHTEIKRRTAELNHPRL